MPKTVWRRPLGGARPVPSCWTGQARPGCRRAEDVTAGDGRPIDDWARV